MSSFLGNDGVSYQLSGWRLVHTAVGTKTKYIVSAVAAAGFLATVQQDTSTFRMGKLLRSLSCSRVSYKFWKDWISCCSSDDPRERGIVDSSSLSDGQGGWTSRTSSIVNGWASFALSLASRSHLLFLPQYHHALLSALPEENLFSECCRLDSLCVIERRSRCLLGFALLNQLRV